MSNLRAGDEFDRKDSLNDIEEDRLFISGLQQATKSRKSYTDNANRKKVLIIAGSVLGALALLALIIALAYGLRRKPSKDFECPNNLALTNTDLVFFVVGDWGRSGSSSQQTTARMMAQVAGCMPPKFIVSTGDNFYPHGLGSPQDPQIQQSFTNVYNAPGLQVPWYAVLGNHDYGDTIDPDKLSSCPSKPSANLSQCQGCCFSPLWQVPDLNPGNLDPRWHLQQGAYQLRVPESDLDITFIDTSPFIRKYRGQAWANLPGGLSSQDPAQQMAKIEQLLNTSAKLKIVVGHHPMRSWGKHCQDPYNSDCDDMLVGFWSLLFKYKVVAYMAGHDHDLQLIRPPVATDPITYVVSGAGSDIREDEFDQVNPGLEGINFFVDDQGFVAVLVRNGAITLYYYVSHSTTHVMSTRI